MTYVEKEKVLEIAKDEYYSDFHKSMADLTSLRELLEDTPATDVVEVRHGHWGKHYKSGTTVSDGFVSSCCDMWNERKTSYCPNCGAKMNKGEDEG